MKKRLRFFITTLNSGGAEKVLINLLNWLDPEKYDICLLTVCGGKNEGKIPDYVNYRSILKNRRLSKFLQIILLKLPERIFASLFLNGEYDYEIAYLEGKPTSYILHKKTKAKKIAFIHCDLSVNKINNSFYRDPSKCLRAYRQFDTVCFVSADALKGFEKAIGVLDNSKVVHNVIDYSAVKKGSRQKIDKDYTSKGLRLITVGRLSKEKNYSALISVVSELSSEYDLELWIIGDGDQRENLEKIKKETHSDNVHLLGYSENPYPYVKKADLYVCSSEFEGYNTAVLESVIIGTPVLTTDCAGMSELLDEGKYGLIVENSRNGLKEGIRYFAENPSKLSEYKNNVSEFSPEHLPFESEYSELFC